MAACQQWTDTPPPFLFWVSTVQPPLNCLFFSCPQAPFSTRDERKRKEKAKRSSLKKPQKKPFCWWASRASYSTKSSPVVMPEMLSVTLDVVWESACPRTVQKHRACSISVYSSKRATMVLDAAWKETFLSFLLKTGLLRQPSPSKSELRIEETVLIVIMPLFSFSTFFRLLGSFLSPFHPARNKMEVKIDFLCELWY